MHTFVKHVDLIFKSEYIIFIFCSFSDIIINTYCGCCQYRYFLLHFDLPNFYGQRHLQVSDSDLDLRGLGKLPD